jgi:hypothetical protein
MVGRLRHGLPEMPVHVELEGAPALPEPARLAVSAADRPRAGPRPGELWRALDPRGGAAMLVWVRAVSRQGTSVIAVSFDVELADEYALVVDEEGSPLGVPLAVHVALETVIDKGRLLDRLGSLDIASAVESVRSAVSAGELVAGAAVGARPVSPLDERVEYRQVLADRMAELAVDEVGATDGDADAGADGLGWWPVDDPSERAALLVAIHEALAETHPAARITPRPSRATAGAGAGAVALVAELDAFVLVASLEHEAGDHALLDCARRVLQDDQLLNAVCVTASAAPFMSVVVDRRDVVDAIETPSGELRPPRQSRPPAPIGEALTKFLDSTISPFGRLAATVVDGDPIDPRALAVDVSADAVRAVEASARAYKVEGKRPGYERVVRHKAAITRLVEEALGEAPIDVASFLEPPE